MSYEDFCELCRYCWQQKYGFVVIDKDSAFTNDTEKNLKSLRYLNVINRCWYVKYETFSSFKYNMDSKELKERERE